MTDNATDRSNKIVFELVADWYAGYQDEVLGKLAKPETASVLNKPGTILAHSDIRAAYNLLSKFLDNLRETAEADYVLSKLIEKFPRCRQALLVSANREIKRGDAHAAISLLKKALSIYANDVFAENMLIDAYMLLGPDERPAEAKAAKANLNGRFCEQPFRSCFTNSDGNVYLCAANKLPVSAGNMFESTWDEVWNSSAARELRRSIIDGDFSYCSRVKCHMIQAGVLKSVSQTLATLRRKVELGDVYSKEIVEKIETKSTEMKCGPSMVELTHDASCNLSCPSCRSHVIVTKGSKQSKLDAALHGFVLPLLKESQRVWITGSGDPFASKHFRDVLANLNSGDFPNLTVEIMSNGQLFTEKEWGKLQGIHSMIGGVDISIDAATAKTYEIVRRGGSFERLLENLKFISSLRASNKIGFFLIKFLVQARNFREMPAFVELGRELGVDMIGFQRITNWGSFTADEWAENDIFDVSHPDHAEFRRVMKSPQLGEDFVKLGNISSFR